MTELLPSLQAERIREGLVDYLTTTFALADAEPRRALAEFLEDDGHGIFVGPYARLRPPYRQASDGWGDALDWAPPFAPYRHQAEAYRRLTSKGLGPDKPRPLPTIVTTGTGSGKTEAFLHPVVDHVARARRAGVGGTKAIVLYPMNALATDQADRLAALITSTPALSGVTAALYTGDTGPRPRTTVTPEGLITDRRVIREGPPDIILTNYKMLDQLLLRPADQGIWEHSALSLTYLVLDEFHTYDGAQGTDVAMLIRRLGLALRAHTPAGHPDLAHFAERPLGRVTPVATSATLGDGGDGARVLSFARDIFGETFPDDAVVTEQRVDIEEWSYDARTRVEASGLRPLLLTSFVGADIDDLVDLGRRHADDAETLTAAVTRLLYRGDVPSDEITQSDLLRAHPDVRRLIDEAGTARPVSELAALIFPSGAVGSRPDAARQALQTVLAALSHVRAVEGRDEIGVELTLWLREVSRVDRVLSAEPGFRWSDDGDPAEGADGPATPDLPATYCRSCGRSGWMAKLAPTGHDLADDDATVRRDHLTGDGRVRVLVHAPGEDQAAGAHGAARGDDRLRWYHVDRREILAHRPGDDDAERAAGLILPVLMHHGDGADAASRRDECPSCGRPDSIRFLGSAIATLLSVSLSTLFGDPDLGDREKRALVFTDSVQDAAHRAGFISSRSHAMSLRAALRGALTRPMDLEEWVDATLTVAELDPFARCRLVPADVLDHDAFLPYWRAPSGRAPKASARDTVRRRLLLDASLETGLQSTFGRTLESTGSVWVHVDLGTAEETLALAKDALGESPTLDGVASPTEADLVRWVRGVVERLRRDGAIDHPWFERYKQEDGARYRIWGGRPRVEGMPAFPTGRSAPAFAVVGGGRRPEHDTLARVAPAQSWYARWAAKNLRVSSHQAAGLAVRLFAVLADAGIVTTTTTASGARVHGLPPTAVRIGPLDEDDDGPNRLACDTCHTPIPAGPITGPQLLAGPCLAARCPGTLVAHAGDRDSFYRRLYEAAGMRRVDAHEHTSLLDPEDRRAVETGFKRTVQEPGDPNVLVATPTLEMGIDIGDLSTVVLASLPDSVSKYLQRVGRAGRLSGSSLTLAFVTGRGDQLPRLGDPGSLINGAVRPPATYLDAEEIIRRQFIASVIDHLARARPEVIPTKSGKALGSSAPGTLLGEVVSTVRSQGGELVEDFAGTFPAPDRPALRSLRRWVVPEAGDDLVETIAGFVHATTVAFAQEVEGIRHQQKAVKDALPELRLRAETPAASTDDIRAYRSARTALRLMRKQLDDLEASPWISGLEVRGLLPTYSLVDDTVRLDAQVSWIDPDSQRYDSEPMTIDRGAARALHELAPGAWFYARGLEMRVDGIDLADEDEVRTWVLCPDCGYSVDLSGPTAERAPTACPRCASSDIADTGQQVSVTPLSRVFSDLRRDDARIDDSRGDRRRARFEVLPTADFDPDRRTREWSVPEVGLGLVQYRGIAIRWLNFGQGQGAGRLVAGTEVRADGFRLCRACGKLDQDSGRQGRQEHRAWCGHRDSPNEHTRTLALTRQLVTEGTALILPASVTNDSYGVPSLTAALLLGLRETIGGAPTHLDVVRAPHPIADGSPGEVRESLLLHDTVPGGTGYLAELGSPDWLWRVLTTAARVVHTCPCQDEGRASCHRCLLPFARGSATVSRQVAEQSLSHMLLVEEGETIADLDPAVPRWEVSQAPVAKGTGESPLEQKFRARLAERLSALATVKEQPTHTGIRLRVVGLGDRVWTLTPQLLVHGTKPDFVLEAPGVTPVAVYVDGAAYHASVTHNRLRDDAEKRATLRANGYHVVAVTHADLGEPPAPDWLTGSHVTKLMGRPAGSSGSGITQGVVTEQQAGALGLLLGYMQDPDSTPRRCLADALPYLLAPTSHRFDAENDAAVDDLAASLARGLTHDPAPAGQALVHRRDHLTFASTLSPSGILRTSLVLDDSDEALMQPCHRDAWRAWLALSNALSFADVPARIWTTSMIPEPTITEPATIDKVWAGVDVEMATPVERELAAELTRLGAPPPTSSLDEINGVPVTFAWQSEGVVVLIEPDDADLVALGPTWRTVPVSEAMNNVAQIVMSALAAEKE